jgi:hypothetical protein
MDDDTSEYTESNIWESPSHVDGLPTSRPRTPRTPKTPKTPKTPTQERPEPIDHEAALRKELEGVRGINESLEGVISTLERAGGNMNVCFPSHDLLVICPLTTTDRTEHGQQCFCSPQHLDADIIPDRA